MLDSYYLNKNKIDTLVVIRKLNAKTKSLKIASANTMEVSRESVKTTEN